MRLAITIVVQVLANAIGLIVATVVLADMSLSASAFFLDVLIFTLIEVITQPLIMKMSMTSVRALAGSSALVASFVALVFTAWWNDGLQISGTSTWLLATVIVWAAGMLAAFLLPILVFKKWLGPSATGAR